VLLEDFSKVDLYQGMLFKPVGTHLQAFFILKLREEEGCLGLTTIITIIISRIWTMPYDGVDTDLLLMVGLYPD